MAHATLKSKLLRELTERPATAKANTIAGRIRELEEIQKNGNQLSLDLRRIASYLGHEWVPPKATTLHGAKQIRTMIERSDSDEKIALCLWTFTFCNARSEVAPPQPIRPLPLPCRHSSCVIAIPLCGHGPRLLTHCSVANHIRAIRGTRPALPE